MEKDPDLVRRVSNKHMASYLDVGNRTYNLIRKNYQEKMVREAKRGKRSSD
jgi:FixJ family two-component response regulator